MTVQPAQQQKMTYAATTQLQSGIKTQFIAASIAQTQKAAGAQQIQVREADTASAPEVKRFTEEVFTLFFCFQVAKIPQMVQQQSTVANIQQIVSSPQQVGPRCGCTSAPLCCSGGKFKTHFRLVRKCASSS